MNAKATAPGADLRYRVRPARPGDRDAVMGLLTELGYDGLSPDTVKSSLTWALSHPEIEVFVAADALERPVALIAFSHRPQLRLGGRLLTIDELIVTSAWRGRGIGRALVAAAVARARVLGVKRVEVSNQRGRDSYQQGFYTGEGFEEVNNAVLRHREFG
jgi:GNAT superfamily N-acetyltransferase